MEGDTFCARLHRSSSVDWGSSLSDRFGGKAGAANGLLVVQARAERILRDELRSGCRDRLVHGGLESFLRYWLTEARASGPEAAGARAAEAAVAALADYRALDPSERERALRRALGILSEREPVDLPGSPRQPPPAADHPASRPV